MSDIRMGRPTRETVEGVLRTVGQGRPLTTFQNSNIAMKFGLGVQGGQYPNHEDPPPGRTVTCILALLEHIEDLENRIARLERR